MKLLHNVYNTHSHNSLVNESYHFLMKYDWWCDEVHNGRCKRLTSIRANDYIKYKMFLVFERQMMMRLCTIKGSTKRKICHLRRLPIALFAKPVIEHLSSSSRSCVICVEYLSSFRRSCAVFAAVVWLAKPVVGHLNHYSHSCVICVEHLGSYSHICVLCAPVEPGRPGGRTANYSLRSWTL